MNLYILIKKLKEKLDLYIDLYGLNDLRTIKVSQELDIPMAKLQAELNIKR